MTSQHEILGAYWNGLGVHGDPESLIEIGIPVTDQDFTNHLSSGVKVGEMLNASRPRRNLGRIAIDCADCGIQVTATTSCSHLYIDSKGHPRSKATY